MLSLNSTRFDVLLKELAQEHRREVGILARELSQQQEKSLNDVVATKSSNGEVSAPLLHHAEIEVKRNGRRANSLPPILCGSEAKLEVGTNGEMECTAKDSAGSHVVVVPEVSAEFPVSLSFDEPPRSMSQVSQKSCRFSQISASPSAVSHFSARPSRLTPQASDRSLLTPHESDDRVRSSKSLRSNRCCYEVKEFLQQDDEDLSESGSESSNQVGFSKRTQTWSSSLTTQMGLPLSRKLSSNLGSSERQFTMHPESKANIMWICASTGMLFYDILMVPLQAFQLKGGPALTTMNWSCTIFWTLDILRTSACGYYNRDGELVRAIRAILLNYMRTWLFFDVSLAVFDWFLLVGGGRSFNSLARIMRSARIVRLFRLAKMLKFIRAFEERFSSEFVSVVWTIAKQFIGIIVLNHFLACAWYKIGDSGANISWVTSYLQADASFAYRYSTSLHWAFSHFINTNVNVYPTNLGERVYGLFTILLGLVVASTFISSITSAIVHLGELQKKQRKQLWMLRKYLATTGVSTRLVIQIQNYCESAISRVADSVSEDQVDALKVLSTPLRKELRVAMTLPVLRKHHVLGLIEANEYHIIEKICDNGTSKAEFLANDHIFTLGDLCTQMYFVVKGAFSYQCLKARKTQAFNTATSLADRSWNQDARSIDFEVDEGRSMKTWCEAALWTTWTHCGTLAVDADCEVLLLNSNVFEECVTAMLSQTLFRSMCAYAKDFVEALNNDRICNDLFCYEGNILPNKRRSRAVSAFSVVPFSKLGSLK